MRRMKKKHKISMAVNTGEIKIELGVYYRLKGKMVKKL